MRNMKTYSSKNTSNGGHMLLILLLLIVIGLLIGLYVTVAIPCMRTHEAVTSVHARLLKSLPFGGPYEQCEDMVCPNFDGKKECMHDKAEDIMKCCQSVCHAKCVNLPEPALNECLSACTPLF